MCNARLAGGSRLSDHRRFSEVSLGRSKARDKGHGAGGNLDEVRIGGARMRHHRWVRPVPGDNLSGLSQRGRLSQLELQGFGRGEPAP